MKRSNYLLNATSIKKFRSSWTQSSSHKTSLPFGKVVPIGMPVDVLPGDSWMRKFGAIIRMLTPKAPLMDGISGDLYPVFIPNRLLFDRSKQFFGQNENEAWTLNFSYTIPHLKLPLKQSFYSANEDNSKYVLTIANKNFSGSLIDHFEIPIVYLNKAQYDSVPASASSVNLSINALPFRHYQMTWNEIFRNPAVVDPMLDFNYDHSDVIVSPSFVNTHPNVFDLKPVMRYRDLFSSALKAPQRGPSATLPLGTTARLIADPSKVYEIPGFSDSGDGDIIFANISTNGGETNSDIGAFYDSADQKFISATSLFTDLSSASAATVNTLRNAIALQHLYEMMTNAFRYDEYTEVFFGVRASNAVLDKPQLLGGMHFNITVNQVLSTADSSGKSVGDTGAYSMTSLSGRLYNQSFTEHGIIILYCVLRKEHTYVQGLDKFWRKRDFLDFYQSPLEGIGNVDIKNSEVFFKFKEDGTLNDDPFGYTEPYYEYRYQQSRASGLMNPLHPSSLSFYSLTDVLSDLPYLNEAFVSEDKNGLDNALVASADVTDQFFADFYFRDSCSRVMRLYSIPGLNRI